MKSCYNSIIRTTCDWNKTSPFPSSVFWLPCQRHTIDTDFMANTLLLQAMENNYGYSRMMKQQVEVWQRGSVNFKHRCATRKPVFIHTRKPGAWQPRETLSCHLSTLILAWRQDENNPFSGMQSVPVSTSKVSHLQLWNTKGWLVSVRQ